MEIKKSPKAALQNKRGLLLEIGLIIALGGVIAAFAWTPKEQKIEKLDLNIAPVEEEIMEITRLELKPPESRKKTEITVITDILKVVTNDTKITTNVDFAEFEDDVEIGANTCIDRAKTDSTVIRRGVKLDNLIQIGHNVQVGENTVSSAQTGIAGTSKVGSNCFLAGQVGIADHVNIGNNVKIGSKSGLDKDVPDGEIRFGYPALPGMQYHRSATVFKRLPELEKRVNELEKQLAASKK